MVIKYFQIENSVLIRAISLDRPLRAIAIHSGRVIIIRLNAFNQYTDSKSIFKVHR